MALPFRDRLRLAAAHAKVEYSQTAIARSLGIGRKQTVDRWMGDGMPTPPMIYRIADTWSVDPRWLATGEGTMLPQVTAVAEPAPAEYRTSFTGEELALIASYRKADPRWRLSLRLLAALADPNDQIEAATDVNYVVARIMGKKPLDVRYASDRRVEEAFGQAPHVADRKAKQRR